MYLKVCYDYDMNIRYSIAKFWYFVSCGQQNNRIYVRVVAVFSVCIKPKINEVQKQHTIRPSDSSIRYSAYIGALRYR